MTIFWITIPIVFIFSLLARYYARPVIEGHPEVRPSKVLAFVPLVIFVLVSGLRSNIGDTETYIYSYKIMEMDLNHALAGGDFGFNAFQIFLKQISPNPQIMIFTTALMTNVLIFFALYSYADLFELGTYLYITTGCYLVSMNGIRQYLASAIIFAAVKFLIDGNWKKYFFFILLASTIHASALIMIPVYFIIRRKAWSVSTLIIMAPAAVGFLFFNQMMSVALLALGNTQYGHYKELFASTRLGANFIRVIISAVPLILAFYKREELKQQWPESDYFVNFSMMNLLFMLFATYNWIMARFCIYFSLYSLVLLARIIKTYRGKGKALIYTSLVFCYLIFYYYEQVISLNIVYESDILNKIIPFVKANINAGI